jgi:hypothetical protein
MPNVKLILIHRDVNLLILRRLPLFWTIFYSVNLKGFQSKAEKVITTYHGAVSRSVDKETVRE